MDMKIFQMFSDFQKKDFLTDVKVRLKNGSINAHKIVLAANSDFFRMLFSNSSYKESTSGIVNLPSIECNIFSYILDCMYFRNEEVSLVKDIAFCADVIVASDYLGMLDFINYIDLKVAENFNSLFIRDYEKIMCYTLKKTSQKFEKAVIKLINNKSYDDIVNIHGDLLLKFMGSDCFAIDENVLFDFLLYYYDQNRNIVDSTVFEKLFNNVRVSNLDTKHLLIFHKFKIDTDLNIGIMNDCVTKPRCDIFLFLVRRKHDSLKIDQIDFVDRDISNIMITNYSDSTLCRVYGHHLIMFRESVKCDINFGSIINLATGNFSNIDTIECVIPEVGYYYQYGQFALVLMDTYLIVSGGLVFAFDNVATPSKYIVKYNIRNNVWEVVQNVCLREPCWSHAMSCDSKCANIIYVSGGRNQYSYLTSVYNIDLKTSVIVDIVPLPRETYGHRMECQNNHLIVFDGNHKTEVFLLDLGQTVWRIITMSLSGTNLHVGYCFSISDDDHRRLSFYQLTSDVIKNKLSVYRSQVNLLNPDNVVVEKPVIVVDMLDKDVCEVFVGRGIYDLSYIDAAPQNPVEPTMDSD